MNITATIKKIKYQPFLCSKLMEFPFYKLSDVLQKSQSTIIKLDDQNKIALSSWVSPKRTRSYPYARVYNTLYFVGKKVTVIPVIKDEGLDGDRDFIQWDTISLMSLLGVYVIIGYYQEAERNPKYFHKITRQRFDANYIAKKIEELRHFQLDALHWNLIQAQEIGAVAQNASQCYQNISNLTGVKMHSQVSLAKKIAEISASAKNFIQHSRNNARAAQRREALTEQPKEQVNQAEKSTITIKNYLGGEYYFTADEAWIEGNNIFLAECKHSKNLELPAQDDIKDGLIKMVLFTNLEEVMVSGKEYLPQPVLRLTSSKARSKDFWEKEIVATIYEEAKKNNFHIKFD